MVLFINIIYTVLIFLWLLVVIPIAMCVGEVVRGAAIEKIDQTFVLTLRIVVSHTPTRSQRAGSVNAEQTKEN